MKQALIFAAGHATRMRPLTDDLPKPLLIVDGVPLLTHIVRHLDDVGVTKIIINGYHAIGHLRHYMADIRLSYPHIEFILSEETELLETGGGAVLASQYFDMDAPLYMVNGDAYWINAREQKTLEVLASAWRDDMDCLLLLQSITSMEMTEAVGDYDIDDNGHAIRSLNKKGAFMFTGVRMMHPRLLRNRNVEKFSFLECMDDAQSRGALYAIPHQGEWYHLSTPQDLDDVNAMLGFKTETECA